MKFALRWLVVVCLIALPTARAFAQGANTKATLTGAVQDVSGAVVPGASVTIRNVATGVTNETISNETGTFAVAALDAGHLRGDGLAGRVQDVQGGQDRPHAWRHRQRHGEARSRRDRGIGDGRRAQRAHRHDVDDGVVDDQFGSDPEPAGRDQERDADRDISARHQHQQHAHAAQLDRARTAAERHRHRHRRRQHPGSERQVDRRLLSRHPAAERSRRTGERRGGNRHRRFVRPGRGADQVRDPLGIEHVHRQRLRIPARQRAQLELVGQLVARACPRTRSTGTSSASASAARS